MQTAQNIKQLIEQIKETIVKGSNPQKIVLFGSFAQGQPGQDSDLDILVIKESALRRDKRARKIHELFNPYPYPMDILVYTPQEVAEYKNFKGSFISQILSTGKVIYERG